MIYIMNWMKNKHKVEKFLVVSYEMIYAVITGPINGQIRIIKTGCHLHYINKVSLDFIERQTVEPYLII